MGTNVTKNVGGQIFRSFDPLGGPFSISGPFGPPRTESVSISANSGWIFLYFDRTPRCRPNIHVPTDAGPYSRYRAVRASRGKKTDSLAVASAGNQGGGGEISSSSVQRAAPWGEKNLEIITLTLHSKKPRYSCNNGPHLML